MIVNQPGPAQPAPKWPKGGLKLTSAQIAIAILDIVGSAWAYYRIGPVAVFWVILVGVFLWFLLDIAGRLRSIPNTALGLPVKAMLWMVVIGFGAFLLFGGTSLFFSWPRPEIARYMFSESSPIASVAPASISLVQTEGGDYFRRLTEPFGNTPDGRAKTSQRILIKKALEKISAPTDKWQSVVLKQDDVVSSITNGADYLLVVSPIVAHGSNFSGANKPLVSWFGWVERYEDGDLTVIPLKSDEVTSGDQFGLRFTIPIMMNKDKLVICLQRKVGAEPASLTEGAAILMNKAP